MLFDTEDVREILEVRERLEAGFIDVAIAAMDEETLDELQVLVDKMRQKASRNESFLEEDLAFHRAIYLRVGNHLLIKLLDIFWQVYKSLRNESLHTVKDLNVEAQNHAEILQAIKVNDVVLVQRRLIEHFNGIKERLKTVQLSLNDGDEPAPIN